jgi:uncharacterized membrane protein HdeD (DUF308 family)
LALLLSPTPHQHWSIWPSFLGYFCDGVVNIVLSLSSSRVQSGWVFGMLLGALQALLGVYLLQRPGITLVTFVTFVALSLMVRGVMHFVEAFNGSYDAVYRTWQIIAGFVALVASLAIWRYPVKGTLAFVWILGGFALVNGALQIAFALEARNGFSKK